MEPLSPRAVALASAMVSAVVLAGCLASESINAPQGVAKADETTGAIRGYVQDDGLVPLPGAEVGILERNLITKTDEKGEFVLNGLPPGLYRVAAAKLGYSTQARTVDVKVGQVASVNFALEPVAVLGEGYVVTIIEPGYLACGLFATVVVVSNVNVCAWDTNHKPQIDFDVFKAQDPQTILLELSWQRASAATGSRLAYGLWKDPGCQPSPCESENRIEEVTGESPLRAESGRKAFDKRLNAEGATLFSALTFVGGGQPVVLVYQQRTTNYISIFYGAPAPDEFTAIPPE